jgi:hypothetical protein
MKVGCQDQIASLSIRENLDSDDRRSSFKVAAFMKP